MSFITENRIFRTMFTVLLFLHILRSYIWFGLVVKQIFRSENSQKKRIRRLHARNAARVYRAFILLKGVYIKVGQFLSTQLFLPPEYLHEMVKMQDRVPRAATSQIRERVLKEFGKEVEEVFARFDPEPLACASIGQVHRVTLKTGEEGVIKVKYPGIDGSFIKDLKLLRQLVPLFIKIIEVVYYGARSGINHHALVGEFVKYIRMELDYANEIKNHKNMYAILHDQPHAVAPKLYEDLCSHSIICMEYIEAEKMIDFFVAEDIDQEEKNQVYLHLANALLYQVSKYGLFQADTHPGNFMVRGEPGKREVVFIDFGCVKKLPDEFRQGILKSVQGYINRDAEMAAKAYWEMGFRTKKSSLDSLTKWAEYAFDLVDLVLDHFSRGESLAIYVKQNGTKMAEDSLALSLTDRIDYVPEEYIMFGRAIATPPVPYDRFQPQVDLMQVILPHMVNLGQQSAEIPVVD